MKDILSKTNIEDLKSFEQLFLKWQKTINLVSNASLSTFWERHVLDSVQLYPYVKNKTILDLGSGGGFPALILAIMDIENFETKIYLAERDERKSAFLKEVVRKFSLNAEVLNKSIEDIESLDFDIITSRALAEVNKIFDLSYSLINETTVFYLLKGRKSDIEIENAKINYEFDIEKIASQTDNESWILKISNLKKRRDF